MQKKFPWADFERSMDNLKGCPQMLRDQIQQSVAPGVKFGIFGGSRQLTDEGFKQQVFASGNQAHLLKSGRRNERNYYSKLVKKVKMASNQLTFQKDIDDELIMPPLQDCKVKDPKDPRNIKAAKRVLKADESSFLIQPNRGRPGQDANMQQEEAMVYSNEAKDIIERAKKGRPITDVYD